MQKVTACNSFLSKELNPALDWDDRQPRISWREDGQFFAVTLVHAITGLFNSR